MEPTPKPKHSPPPASPEPTFVPRNNTELICTRLLGWKTQFNAVHVMPDGTAAYHGEKTWPDFSKWEDCREFESALFWRGLWLAYVKELVYHMTVPAEVEHTLVYAALYASVKHRVVACAAVLLRYNVTPVAPLPATQRGENV